MSHFNYEICERFAPIFLRRTHVILELLKNSIMAINKTALIDRFHKTEIDGELIFQQLY
ncbi:hypothetical protein LEP1GSC021_1786 [Leptospira noguchii str. 1993005606]|nr:hypothetical protein LEP1GSC021_1786 [Leptospira noguchii str. 1993005606]